MIVIAVKYHLRLSKFVLKVTDWSNYLGIIGKIEIFLGVFIPNNTTIQILLNFLGEKVVYQFQLVIEEIMLKSDFD